MPASQTPRARLFRELKAALDEVDMDKVALRRSMSKVTALMRKLNIHVSTHRNTKKRRKNGKGE